MRLEEIKLKKKEENNCTRKLSNVRSIKSIFDSFRVCVIAKESF